MTHYLFDNALQAARERLTLLETCYDAATFRRLQTIPIQADWHCWEIGAGAGSVAHWLSQKIEGNGRLLVTDTDTRFLEGLDQPHVEIRVHNVSQEPLPEEKFHLIHARLVLMHLRNREIIIEKLREHLLPGGWLFIEDYDLVLMENGHLFPIGGDPALYEPAVVATERMAEYIGMATQWARRLPLIFTQLGLENLQVDTQADIFRGGNSPMARFFATSWRQMMGPIQKVGGRPEDLQRVIDWMEDESLWLTGPLMVAVWGQRPLP